MILENTQKRPEWIRAKISLNKDLSGIGPVLDKYGLNTVCDAALCPNRNECWAGGHVTFMILGDICTRNCRFCNIDKSMPRIPDTDEPSRIAGAVKELGLDYVVITSVTRDDIPDGGCSQFLRTVKEIKKERDDVAVELLIPDFNGDAGLLRSISFSGADVIGHNIEIPERLYKEIRPRSDYSTSIRALEVLSGSCGDDVPVKTSLIIGLGEREEDIIETMHHIFEAGTDILYIGQYLAPSTGHWPVEKFYSKDEFLFFEEEAGKIGFKTVLSGPLVRSSYRARDIYRSMHGR